MKFSRILILKVVWNHTGVDVYCSVNVDQQKLINLLIWSINLSGDAPLKWTYFHIPESIECGAIIYGIAS